MNSTDNIKRFFHEMVTYHFQLTPIKDQAAAIQALVDFTFEAGMRSVFVLSGYAGTGKTTLLGAYVKSLLEVKRKTMLLAPTGRAAKVLAQRSNKQAFTIHKIIYRKETLAGGAVHLVVAPNLMKNTIFIVDEASMIGDYSLQSDGSISGRNLLQDLINFVFSNSGNQLIFVGDEGQLPPVGSDFSPALNRPYLADYYSDLFIVSHQLKQVVRQSADSDILLNATALRSAKEGSFPQIKLNHKKDLISIFGGDLQEALEDSYAKFGSDETIIITRSNKRSNMYNQQIRNRILWFEEDLCGGDRLMVVKNNYYWLDDQTEVGFIANGEMIQVLKILKREEKYSFQFAKARIQLVDYPMIGDLEVLLMVDVLTSESPAMPRPQLKELFFELEQEYSHELNKKKRYELIMKDPYFNALQVKFAYAITCHKSQGGQWESVFLDHGYLTDEMLDQSFFRWLYTGFTRASERLCLVNFDPHFFPDHPKEFS